MLEERFSFNGVTGLVRRLPKLRTELGAAAYTAAIMRTQGAELHMEELTSDVYALKVFTMATDFANVAVRLSDVAGLPFVFPHSSAKVEDINAAFEWYIDHSEDGLWEHLQGIIKRMDLPNGKGGAPIELISEADQQNPLSVPSGNGSGSLS